MHRSVAPNDRIVDDADQFAARKYAFEWPDRAIDWLQELALFYAHVEADAVAVDAFRFPDMRHKIFRYGHIEHFHFRHDTTPCVSRDLQSREGYHKHDECSAARDIFSVAPSCANLHVNAATNLGLRPHGLPHSKSLIESHRRMIKASAVNATPHSAITQKKNFLTLRSRTSSASRSSFASSAHHSQVALVAPCGQSSVSIYEPCRTFVRVRSPRALPSAETWPAQMLALSSSSAAPGQAQRSRRPALMSVCVGRSNSVRA